MSIEQELCIKAIVVAWCALYLVDVASREFWRWWRRS